MGEASSRWTMTIVLVAAALLMAVATPADAQWAIESKDGKSSIKFGFLVQGWAETLEHPDGEDSANNLYFRRLRLLAGGKITDKFTFFMETDSPNLGKGNPDGTKQRSDVYIQDFVLSYKFADAITLDGGLILIPTCYNCTQSAASLLPVDYGAFSFLSSAPTTANVGRDYGLLARGYLVNDRLEYRAGVFQGKRDEDASNAFRYVGRVMWNFFEPQKGLFYVGSSLGKKKLLSIGASYDTQDDYSTYAFDIFFDYPLFDSDGLTLQADWVHYDGGDFLTSLPETDAYLFEAAYYFGKVKLAPFVQYIVRDPADEASPKQTNWQGGLAYYPMGQRLTVKLGLGQLELDGAPSRFRGILQVQVFMF
ncbi:MAG: porin [Candidatus Sulfomarinibacteraceae bacterium]